MRFSNYFNKRSNRNNIYSYKNLMNMRLQELFDREDELDYQNESIGFPDDEELMSSPSIESYTDDLGNQGWRAKLNNLNNNIKTSFGSLFAQKNNSDNTQMNDPMPTINNGETIDAREYIGINNSPKILEGSVSTNNIKENLKDYARKHFKTYQDYERLTGLEKVQKYLAKRIPDWIPTEYYGLGLELSDDGVVSEERAQNNDIYKVSDIQDEEKAKFIRAKIEEARRLNPNGPYTNTPVDDVKVVVPKDDSPIMKQIKNSPAFEDFVVKNYEKLKNRKGESINTSMQFPLSRESYSLGATIHNTDVGNLHVNNDDSMSGELGDFADYSYWGDKEKRPTIGEHFQAKRKLDKDTWNDFLHNIAVDANDRAYYQQKAGKYEPYFFNKEFNLSEEEIEEMYEHWRRRKGK